MAATQQRMPIRKSYPKGRPPFFFHSFVRLLLKHTVANTVSPVGCWFLTQIAALEDTTRYSRSITWTDAQLCPFMGISPSTLVRVRKKCVDAGWLHFDPGARGRPSHYWVTVPDWLIDDDRITDEFTFNLNANPERIRSESGVSPERKRSASGALTSLDLNPNPSPTPNPGGGGISEDVSAQSDASPDETAQSAIVVRLRCQSLTESLKADQSGNRRLSHAASTASGALSVGHTVDSVNAICDHVESRPDFWGGGALRRRLICDDLVDLPPDEGWPDPDEKALLRWKQRREREAAESQRKASDAAHQQELDRQRAEMKQLELQFWPIIEAMDETEVVELIRDQPLVLRQYQRNNDRHAIRFRLINAYAAKVAAT